MKFPAAAMMILLLSGTGLSGCYEGWESDNVAGPVDPGPGPISTKPIFYILYQPIYLSAGAVADDTCFDKTGVRDYRKNEWSLRSTSLQQAMGDIAEKVVTIDLGVNADDCTTLQGVRNSAIASAPWGTDGPGTDALGRPVIHVKAVFYDGEPQLSPPSVVTREHWEAIDEMVVSGRNARSRHYFVIANADDGYFSEWRNALTDDVRLDGTSIDNVDPTPDGLDNRNDVISADTANFSSWLLQ